VSSSSDSSKEPQNIFLADEYGLSLRAIKDLLKKNEARQPWQVSDRLSAQDIERLLQAFRAGTPKWQLAEMYGVSLTSVKRLVRQSRS
jgi:hypothetical protein